MSRFVILFALCTFFSLASVGQILRDEAAEHGLNNGGPHVLNAPGHRSDIMGNARISVTRLREPCKARKAFTKAMDAWRKGRSAEAVEWYRKVLRLRSAEAQRKLDEALKIYPAFPEALTFYGCIHAEFKQWDSAEKELQAAIETDPSYSPAYVVLAGVYNAQGRFDEAQQAIQLGLSAGADTWHVQYEIARSLIGKRDYDGALAAAEAALHSRPDGGLLHLAKVHALLGLRRYLQAATELNIFLHYDPAEMVLDKPANCYRKYKGRRLNKTSPLRPRINVWRLPRHISPAT